MIDAILKFLRRLVDAEKCPECERLGQMCKECRMWWSIK